MKKQMVHWGSLAEIGFVFGAALVAEARLPFSPGADSWLLGLWVLLFYGAVSAWISSNRVALERASRPVDCIGRPIVDSNSEDGAEIAETNETANHSQLPAQLSRSKVI